MEDQKKRERGRWEAHNEWKGITDGTYLVFMLNSLAHPRRYTVIIFIKIYNEDRLPTTTLPAAVVTRVFERLCSSRTS